MNFVQRVIGFAFAGMLAMAGWGAFVDNLGIIGGVLAGLLIIFPMWLMNHYNNLTLQEPDAGFVDMGLAIGVAGVARDVFMTGEISAFTDSLPTLIIVILGAAAGGFVAAQIELNMEGKAE